MTATFPGAIASFATKTDAVTQVMAADVNSLQEEVVAIETGLLTWTGWVPTQTGFSSAPAGGTYRYCTIGKTVICAIAQPNAGTSNATTFTMTLPVTPANVGPAGGNWSGPTAYTTDNGSVTASPGLWIVKPNDATLYLYKTSAAGAWTNSGDKSCSVGIVIYERA